MDTPGPSRSMRSRVTTSLHMFNRGSDGMGMMSDDAVSKSPPLSRFRVSVLDFIRHYSTLIIVLMIFVAVGIWVLDDYGMAVDEGVQRNLAIRNINYLLRGDEAILRYDNFYYGMVFEMPLLMIERMLGLDDSRHVWLMRHIITHLFFLVGGLFCYLLAYRMFDNKFLAILAMLLFLLHPRLYAHSFFNSKDIPFLSMFMICLYLIHRSFSNGNVWQFVLCGIGVGILINLRIVGIMLLLAVIGMRTLDIFQASTTDERKRVLITTGAFVLMSLIVVYGVSPYLWGDPVEGFIEWFNIFSQHPTNVLQLFRGELIYSKNVHPAGYIPLWLSITTPPIMLLLGAAGMLIVLMRGLKRPSEIIANTRLRFSFLLIGCFLLPIVAVIVLSSNIYNGWRQMYFLCVPLCVLSVFGIHWLVSSRFKAPILSTAVYVASGVGIAATVAGMISIHPHQQVYFNFLADRLTPNHIRSNYDMDYWGAPFREALEILLERYPFRSIYVQSPNPDIARLNREILPLVDRHRTFVNGEHSDFRITNHRRTWANGEVVDEVSDRSSEDQQTFSSDAVLHTRQIYNSTTFSILSMSPIGGATDDAYREILSSTASDEPIAQSHFDLYLDDDAIIYVKTPCVIGDTEAKFFLHIDPYDLDELPAKRKQYGFDNLDFDFYSRGAAFDDKCIAKIELPDYDIANIRTGQFTSQGKIWGADLTVSK